MQKFIIDAALAQAIADYLVTRPYREVIPYMGGLAALQPYDEPASTGDAPVAADQPAPEKEAVARRAGRAV